jgi:hypothetical protein
MGLPKVNFALEPSLEFGRMDGGIPAEEMLLNILSPALALIRSSNSIASGVQNKPDCQRVTGIRPPTANVTNRPITILISIMKNFRSGKFESGTTSVFCRLSGTNIICSLEGELYDSDSLDDSRGADEESELGSVHIHHTLGG